MNAPSSHSRAPLSAEDIQRLVKSENADDRAVATHKICRIMDRGGLTEQERDAAHAIVRMLAKDAAELVRRALAVTLRASDMIPHDVAMTLAQDALSIAVPMLKSSPVFTDADLADIVRRGGPARQVAIAHRDHLPETVTGALAEVAVEEAVVVACANDNARFTEADLSRVVSRFETSKVMHNVLVNRAVLPISISERLVHLVSARLREQLVMRHAIRPETATEIAEAARERATLDLVDQTGRYHDPRALAHHLATNDRLTASLLLRALVRGHIGFFEHGLAELSGVPHTRTWLMVHDAGSLGLRAIYDRAGLPARLFPTFRLALELWRSLTQENGHLDRGQFQTALIERFLTCLPYAPREDLIYLYERLDRRPPAEIVNRAA